LSGLVQTDATFGTPDQGSDLPVPTVHRAEPFSLDGEPFKFVGLVGLVLLALLLALGAIRIRWITELWDLGKGK